MQNEIYIDTEWFPNQKIFLLGYAYNLKNYGQLFESDLNRNKVISIFFNIKYIYFYGPDIAMIEKNFNINLRNNFNCINLLKAAKQLKKGLPSHKLINIEQYYGISRQKTQYKQNIFNIYTDWFKQRKSALKYNIEDTINLIHIKKLMFREHYVTTKQILNFKLK